MDAAEMIRGAEMLNKLVRFVLICVFPRKFSALAQILDRFECAFAVHCQVFIFFICSTHSKLFLVAFFLLGGPDSRVVERSGLVSFRFGE